MSTEELQARLDVRRAENRDLQDVVAQLRARVAELEANANRSSDSKDDLAPLNSILVDPVDSKQIPESSRKRAASRSTGPSGSGALDGETTVDVKPRLSKKRRMKVEVVIERPPSSRPRARKRDKSRTASAIPPKTETDEDCRVPLLEADYVSLEPAVEQSDTAGPSRSEIPENEHALASDAATKVEPMVEAIPTRSATIAPADIELPCDTWREMPPRTTTPARPPKPRATKPTQSKIPKVEVKKSLEFDAATVQTRIDAIGRDPFPITLEAAIRDVCVSRAYMSAVYGGNPQATFPSIKADRVKKHGLDDFCYMSLKYNPAAPREPGHPGLWFDTEPFSVQKGQQLRTFMGLSAGKWLYVGQYKFFLSQDLSQEEWLLQSMQVQNTWTREICSNRWGTGVRARVAFRRLNNGREPTKQDLVQVKQEQAFEDITQEDIRAAYNKGEEHLCIAAMKCVGYDEAFQRKIGEGFLAWTPPPPKAKKGPKHAKKEKKAKGRASMRKAESETEVDDDDYELKLEDDGADDEIEEILPSTSQGTRSRPRNASRV